MRSHALIAALSVVTVFVALDGQSAHAQTQNDIAKPATTVTVQPGDSLTKIATEHSTTYVRVYDANVQIEHPDIIHPGTNLRIPEAEEVLPSRPLPAAAASQTQRNAAAQPKAQRQTVAPISTGNIDGGVWDRLAQCESGGNWSINTGNGYSGGLQFSQSSWRAVGGSGQASQASKAEQIARAEMLQARQGWGAWPACTAKLGIR